MIELVSVPGGQDSEAQSRTPKPKFMFVQRQVMLLLAHPRLGASASMLLMHVFCVYMLLLAILLMRLGDGARQRRLTPQAGRLLIALRSWARARLANSAAVARKSCIVDVVC